MVTTRTSQQMNAGGRSGVSINKVDDSNADIDDWFDAARTPESNAKLKAVSSPKDKHPVVDDGRSKMKGSRKKTVKTPIQKLNMALTGNTTEDDGEDEGDSNSAKKYVSNLRRKGSTAITSPSDLSRVSTAPFTPRSASRRGVEESETIEPGATSKQDGDGEIESSLMTQDNFDERDSTGEIDPVARQSAYSVDQNVVNSEEAEFSVDEDDGEDLGPPELPHDLSNDETEELLETKTRTEDEKNISGSVGNRDDFDDDDGDEGSGFNMVHEPETPLTVREDRAKKEMDKIKEERKKRKQKPKYGSESDEEEKEEESKSDTPVQRSRRQRKKKNRNVVFSPKGVPIANRDYETVPIGTLVEDSPDETGPRRSRRARFKPLEFWRGEKMQFGAHNEYGYIGKAFGDMPIVTGIQKALPTPYKKRKPKTTNLGAKKSSRKDESSESNGFEEFNSKKLRRKYKFHDGEEAYLWDDITEDTADQSKSLNDLSQGLRNAYTTVWNKPYRFLFLCTHRGCRLLV